MTSLSIMGLVPRPGKVLEGTVEFDGVDITTLGRKDLAQLRGDRIAMIFQQPTSSLNPVYRVGAQIREVFSLHRDIKKAVGDERAVALLESVGIPDPETRAAAFPHEFSGGMAQRAMIAMALALQPELLIADEPTTALDVTIQAQILELMRDLRRELGTAIILITHDLGVVSQVTQRMLVMYSGRIIEQGPTREIINDAQHPYTQGLINALPQMGEPGERLFQIPGSMPSLKNVPSGCPFHPRCNFATEQCKQAMPEYVRSGNVNVACYEVANLIEQEKRMQEAES